MEWQPGALDRGTGTPLHRQLARRIREMIADGRLRAGDVLPPEPQLAAMLGVARGTVARAIHALVLEGVLTRRRRRGTTVLPQREQAVASAQRGPETSVDLAAQAERLSRIEQELLTHLEQMEALQAQLAGELFLLRRQRQWNRSLRQRGTRMRSRARAANGGLPSPLRRRRRSS